MAEGFLQQNTIVSAITPVSLATGANNGDWVSLKNHERCLVVVHKGAGTAGDDPVITLAQATDASGTGSKDLLFSVINEKVGTQSGIASFTRTAQTAATSFTNTASAEAEGLFVIEVKASELDVDGGFTHLQVSIPDVGNNAQIGGALYVLLGCRFQGESQPSPIA